MSRQVASAGAAKERAEEAKKHLGLIISNPIIKSWVEEQSKNGMGQKS